MCRLIFNVLFFFVSVVIGIITAFLIVGLFIFKKRKKFLYASLIGYYFLAIGASMDPIFQSIQTGALQYETVAKWVIIDPLKNITVALSQTSARKTRNCPRSSDYGWIRSMGVLLLRDAFRLHSRLTVRDGTLYFDYVWVLQNWSRWAVCPIYLGPWAGDPNFGHSVLRP